jgi:hypothetical protein
MTLDQVERALTDAVREIQTISGRDAAGIGPQTKPIGEVAGFDSINGLEVGALVSERLGTDVGENPLVGPNGESLTLRMAAETIVGQGGGRHAG